MFHEGAGKQGGKPEVYLRLQRVIMTQPEFLIGGTSHFTAIPQPHPPACRTLSCLKVEVSISNKYWFFSGFKSDPEMTSMDSSFYYSLTLLFNSGSKGAEEEV